MTRSPAFDEPRWRDIIFRAEFLGGMSLANLIWTSRLIVIAAVVFPIGVCSATEEATLFFRSGSQMQGEILSEKEENGRTFVVFRTRSGSILKLDKVKLVQRIVPVGPEYREYEQELGRIQQTPAAHWKMYDWCRESSRRSKFKREMQFHLKRIVELDPTDAKAWQLLGYIDVGGQWLPEEQHYDSIGYVKSRGQWVPAVQVDVDQQQALQEEQYNSRKTALSKWRKHTLPDEPLDVVRKELYRIVDPMSVVFLAENYLRQESEPKLRMLYVEAVGRVESHAARQILVDTVMNDPDRDVSELAMSMLEQAHYDPDAVARSFAIFLDNQKTRVSNRVVNRAARKLARLNRNSAIVPLIGALRTTHTIATGKDPGRITTGFDSTGGVGLSTGGPKTVQRTFSNHDVLEALERITGQSFGFDEQMWKEWFVSQHTTLGYDLRRDLDR